MSDEAARRAVSFGSEAEAYELGRPGYPREAIEFCIGDRPRRVLDLGAGTGKLAAALLALGHEVVAVEPLERMRALIPSAAEALDGSAEAIPLADESVDAAVGRPGVPLVRAARGARRDHAGCFAPAVAWACSGTCSTTTFRGSPRSPTRSTPRIGRALADELRPPFEGIAGLAEPSSATFRHLHATGAEGLIANVASRSTVILADERRRQEVLDRISVLAPSGAFDVPYICVAWRSAREGTDVT